MPRLVTLGDVHYFRRLVAPWSLLGKRVIGQANVWFYRGGRFRRRLLPSIVARMQSLKPDLLLLTGDFVSTALPGEFRDFMRVMKPLTDAMPAVAVPGNHDRYTLTSALSRRFDRLVCDGLRSPSDPQHAYPAMIPIAERWRLLALDAAVPRTLNSRGRLGRKQLDAACGLLANVPDDCGLVVLCHYPMLVPPGVHWSWQHRLADREKLLAVLRPVLERRRGRVQTLYVHGHVHRPWVHVYRDGAAAGLVGVTAGAACLGGPAAPAGQGFWELDLPTDPGEPVLVRHHRRKDESPADHWEVKETRVPAPDTVQAQVSCPITAASKA